MITFYYRNANGEQSAQFANISDAKSWALGLRLDDLAAGVKGCALLGHRTTMDRAWQLVASWENAS